MGNPAVIALVACVAGTAALVAQAPAGIDPIRELLVEVRALRVTLERATTTGTRIQVLMARVQVQEQRIQDATRRITAVRSSLASLDQELVTMTNQMRQFEQHLRRESDPNDREVTEEEIGSLKARIETATARRQELAADEVLIAQQLADAQGRWTDFNERLDQLERSLGQNR